MQDSADGAGERLSAAELAEWREIPTAVISDETGCRGVMEPAVRPVTPGRRFAGQALTIRTARVDDGAPRRALESLRGGEVIVIDGAAHPDTAVWGGNLIAGAQRSGATGVVVDGNVRDTADLRRSGLAVYSRGVTPAGVVWGGEVNATVRCGGVEVRPGALLVGDDDGVIVVPLEGRAALLARCRARLAAESAIQQGGRIDPAPPAGERAQGRSRE